MKSKKKFVPQRPAKPTPLQKTATGELRRLVIKKVNGIIAVVPQEQAKPAPNN